MSVRVRFAPSPTGHVHIGNIRVAIFNWLFARHEGGEFLLRIEDTDLERSTPEAIRTLLDVMDWLGLDYDREPLYQTSQVEHHLAQANRLLDEGKAYRSAKGGGDEAILFRIPVAAPSLPFVKRVGDVVLDVHPEAPVVVDATEVSFALVSKKGKPMPQTAGLAGFQHLVVSDAAGTCLFRLDDEMDGILDGGRSFELPGAAKMQFVRYQVEYDDLVKGTLAKPLDSLRDFVIVRSDGSPLFALANVCDDITQRVTHIIRGDDHVENTYRHVLLYHGLGAVPPRYGHLPMIINQQGKPYSKRDGDAYVGDFREKGYMPDALLNYLSLLGWSPGDDREKLSRDELVALFSLDRVQHAPAQVDLRKLQNLNGQYMVELPAQEFIAECRRASAPLPWATDLPDDDFSVVARLMQSRTKLYTDVQQWQHFFVDLPEYDERACGKFLSKPDVRQAFSQLLTSLESTPFEQAALEAAIGKASENAGIPEGKLNQPLRVAVTGSTVGAGIYETLVVLGRDRTLRRLQYTMDTHCRGCEQAV